MSSHHSRRFFDLHHDQVKTGRERRLQHQADRLQSFLTGRQEARLEYNWKLIFGFICFSYMNIATALYLGYIL